MVRITEELVRKRAEHNELEITTLEELSLHQQDIEKIEYLDNWCKDLKILYLQSNLIPRIENVSRLKKLEYLNLALNNIERVENLEGCESLKKLDLTVNFVGELTSVECLQGLYHFEEMFLTGNPCTEYEHYREYVISALPQLRILDGVEIEKSERIIAFQNFGIVKPRVIEQQESYKKKRAKQKAKAEWNQDNVEKVAVGNVKSESSDDGLDSHDLANPSNRTKQTSEMDEHEMNVDNFWHEKSSYTPESRLALHKHVKKLKEQDDKKEVKEEKRTRKYFADDGRPYNVNEEKLDFSLLDEDNVITLDLAVFRYMNTSLVTCDVQPTYVRVTLKGKIFQLCLPEDVNADQSCARRSQTTGHLLVTMPKTKQMLNIKKVGIVENPKVNEKCENINHSESNSPHFLEVDSSVKCGVDVSNIVPHSKDIQRPPVSTNRMKCERANSKHFVDNLDVPPLC